MSQRHRRARRAAIAALSLLLLVAALVGGIGCCAFSAPRYSGPALGPFDGARFHNPVAVAHASFADLVRWQLRREPGPWRAWTDAPAGPPPPRRVAHGRLRVTFVNHSTLLVQIDGLNILTDPIWSERASPLSWIGPRRARPPGIRFEDLPPIDVVLVSHNHYDHLDLATLLRLARQHRPHVIVGLGNSALLEAKGIRFVTELDWWQSVSVDRDTRVHFVPAQHFSARGLCDRDTALWGGFVIQSASGRVYVAGDTGFGPHFARIGDRLGPLRLALLPIGAARPRWFMAPMHISPAEAVHAHQLLRSATSVAMHFGTFRLGDDGQDEPPAELAKARQAAGVSADRFWTLGFGEGRDVPPQPQ
jgi:L-ascorbate metabolism protein UlaG (beta-lactamase superfamily)